MSRLLALNKPFQVLCQFSSESGRACLGDLVPVRGVYPAGRLDYDSEGLVLLTDDGRLQQRISSPRHKQPKTYWCQVEGQISDAAIAALTSGIRLKDGPARAVAARCIPEPDELWPRDPPIRVRRRIPTSWLELVLTEGRNRQVRRMTAAVAYPTLRLIRPAIGSLTVAGLAPGQWREVDQADIPLLLDPRPSRKRRKAR